MTQEFNDGDNQGEELVLLADKLPASMKLVQSIYNEITGKTETKTKILNGSHVIELPDIEQLHIKIMQLHEQYHIIGCTSSVTIYHINDCKEQFSSFERFKLYDQSSPSPCENIRLEYNFLIKLPATSKPQLYKITIDLHSRAALQQKAMLETGFSRRMIELVTMRTGTIEIEYIDYTVARNFMTAINEWYDSVRKTKPARIIRIIQNYSHTIPSTLKILTLTALFLTLYKLREHFLPPGAGLHDLYFAILIFVFSASLTTIIAGRFGSACERAIDLYSPLSALKLNRGDTEIIDGCRSSNSRSIVNAIFFVAISIALNIASTYLAIKIGIGS